MTHHDFNQPGRADVRGTASEAYAKAADFGQQASGHAKDAANEAVSSMAQHIKGLLDQQVETSADMVGYVAGSIRCAAKDLEQNVPQIARVVQVCADTVDGYAENLRGKSAEEVWQTASQFTRRQPAVVFGLAALAGYLAFRTIKSSHAVFSPSIQPHQGAREFDNA